MYWSSSSVADDSYDAWRVGFHFGYIYTNEKDYEHIYARCVRGGRFECGAETCTDPVSGLVWQKTPATIDTWSNAITHCEGLDLAGHATGWRLPTISELRTLIRGCPATVPGGSCGVTDGCLTAGCRDASCYECISSEGPADGCYWPGAGLEGPCSYYWSSSAVEDVGGEAWDVDFLFGGIGKDSVDAGPLTRCIRDRI